MKHPMSINEAIDHLRPKIKDNPKVCKDCKEALDILVDTANGYIIGMSTSDYMKVMDWVRAGMPGEPDTAFTSGPARQAARLIRFARDEMWATVKLEPEINAQMHNEIGIAFRECAKRGIYPMTVNSFALGMVTRSMLDLVGADKAILHLEAVIETLRKIKDAPQ